MIELRKWKIVEEFRKQAKLPVEVLWKAYEHLA